MIEYKLNSITWIIQSITLWSIETRSLFKQIHSTEPHYILNCMNNTTWIRDSLQSISKYVLKGTLDWLFLVFNWLCHHSSITYLIVDLKDKTINLFFVLFKVFDYGIKSTRLGRKISNGQQIPVNFHWGTKTWHYAAYLSLDWRFLLIDWRWKHRDLIF